ncbi:MAG: DUF4157 domain-containing protein, partial [Planctomycetota bacterium]
MNQLAMRLVEDGGAVGPLLEEEPIQLRSLRGGDAKKNSEHHSEDSGSNRGGLPSALKAGVEHMSDVDLSDVQVHYNSGRPAQLNAHACVQGNQIHLGPGQ